MTRNPRRAPLGREDSSRKRESRQGKSRGLALALAGSVLVHLGIMLVVLPPHFSELAVFEPEEEEPFEVKTVVEQVEQVEPDDTIVARNLPENDRRAPEEAEPEEQEPEKIKELEKEKEKEEQIEEETPPAETPPPPPPTPELDRKIVQQESTDEQEPMESDYLADKANRVDEQTRARETTQLDVLAGKTVPDDLKELTGGDDESRADEPEAEQEQIAESADAPSSKEVAEEPSEREEPEPEVVAAEVERARNPSEQASPEKTEEGDAPAVETAEESPFVSKSSPQKTGASEP